MKSHSILTLALGLCILFGTVGAQTPTEPAEKQETPVAEKTDPMLEAWVRTLAAKIADAHPAIRKSAQEAIVAVGTPAVTHLEKVAAAGDPAAAAEARKLMARIQRSPARPATPDRPANRRGERDFAGAMAERQKKAMDAAKLNDEQKKKVEELNKAYMEKMRSMMEQARNGELDRSEMREIRQEANKAHQEALKATMGEEGFKAYQKEMNQGRRFGNREGRGRRGQRGRGQGGGADRDA